MGPHEYLDAKLCLAARYQFSTGSGRRTFNRNAKVKGHKNSRHLLGFVADDCYLDFNSDQAFFVADARRLGLKVVIEKDHIHIQSP